ncbi:MAG: SRPBCC family protein [Myxococcota bacterium]
MKKVLLVLVALAVAFVGLVATRPAEFKIERSASMNAPAEVVFAQLNDFHKWEAWSPWAKLDPQMKTTYSGAAVGTGAIYEWTGNDKVGTGRMTITDVKPNQEVTIKLEFLKPFEATNTTTFALMPSGESTKVTWTMSGHNNFMAKAMHMVMDMEKMVGPDFEKGLGQMKVASEGAAAKAKEEAAKKAAEEAAAKAAAEAPTENVVQ